jgi:hypothetical protein
MGTNLKGCFLGGMGGRSLVVFQSKKVGFFYFPRNYSFGGAGWGVWRMQMYFFFCDMLI